MRGLRTVVAGIVAAGAMFCCAAGAQAAGITRLMGDNPKSPIAQAVAVPTGAYTLYFISGTPVGPADPSAPKGSPKRMGDAPTQTRSSLDRLVCAVCRRRNDIDLFRSAS
jgi:hypothetical protein